MIDGERRMENSGDPDADDDEEPVVLSEVAALDLRGQGGTDVWFHLPLAGACSSIFIVFAFCEVFVQE